MEAAEFGKLASEI